MTERIYAKAELVDDYLNQLVKKGVKKLGQGQDALVFQHPTLSNVVVKLCRMESASVLWARVCIQHASSNPWLPRIHGIYSCKLRNSKDTYNGFRKISALIFSEKLSSASAPDIEKALGKPLFDFLAEEDMEDAFKNRPDPGLRLVKAILTKIKDPKLVEAVLLLSRRPPKVLNDLGKKNYMRRGHQVVFNDPWFRWKYD